MSDNKIAFSEAWRPATRQLHAGVERTEYGETSEAVFLTSGFVYDNAEQAARTFRGEEEHYQYSRFGNPTVAALERRLADLEGAEACVATATGMGAVSSALLSHVKAGDRVVASRALFGSCHWIVANLLPRYGVETVFVDGCNPDEWAKALSQPTAAVLLESPSNPMLDILDIKAISDLAHKAGAIVVVDNVFASPCFRSLSSWVRMLLSIPAPSTLMARAACWAGPYWAGKTGLRKHFSLSPVIQAMRFHLSTHG